MPLSGNQFIEQAQKDSFGGTQGAAALTQARRGTQGAALTQARKGTQGGVAAGTEGDVICVTSDDEDEPPVAAPHPIFEVFWQVRANVVKECVNCASPALQLFELRVTDPAFPLEAGSPALLPERHAGLARSRGHLVCSQHARSKPLQGAPESVSQSLSQSFSHNFSQSLVSSPGRVGVSFTELVRCRATSLQGASNSV